ncbi:hypothetical protein [Rhizobium phaseoli]|uniref:hypothetical protein n=1 Tax=Rhizobium phaseoli TaxID=396 RepID=UPI0007E959DE|nr:hypothetical protein [Rhizobium phaseoli]
MTKITGWNRRIVLTALAASSLGKAWTTTASAQAASPQPINVGALAERLSPSTAIDQISVDVAFIHSWRLEIGPRGYEKDPKWGEEATSFSRTVFTQLGGNPAALVSAASSEVEEFDKLALSSFQENQPSFRDFLVKIGIEPDGQAGGRIHQSLRDFQALGVSAKADVKTARERSFFWPWC